MIDSGKAASEDEFKVTETTGWKEVYKFSSFYKTVLENIKDKVAANVKEAPTFGDFCSDYELGIRFLIYEEWRALTTKDKKGQTSAASDLGTSHEGEEVRGGTAPLPMQDLTVAQPEHPPTSGRPSRRR